MRNGDGGRRRRPGLAIAGAGRGVSVAAALVVAALVVATPGRALGGAAGSSAATGAVVAPRAAPGPPNDPLFRVQWNLPMIGIPSAWSVTRGSGVTVAVIDTGVAYEDYGAHRRAPDLAVTKFVPGWDFIKNDSHPDDEALPGQPSHGTAIAGVIAQTTGNGIGGAGIAPDAAIMPIRVLDPNGAGANTAVAKGLRFAADHGANVANLSLGGDVQSQEVADAVAYAVAKGVTVVASAGDEGQPSISYPAAYPGVIAVGAVRYDKTRAPYSSYGPRLDLVAPGGDLSVDQNHDGVEDGIVQQTLFGSPSTFCFCFKQGTSSAAAHVSAVAALVIASGRATTPAAVRAVLTTTAEHLGPPGHNDEYGFGLVQAASALGLDAGTQAPAAETTTPTTAPLSAPSTLAALGPNTTAAHPGGRLVTSRSRAGWVSLGVAGGLCALVALAILGRRRRARASGGRPPEFSDGGPGAGNP